MTLEQTRHRVAVFIIPIDHAFHVIPSSVVVLETNRLKVGDDVPEQRLWFNTTSWSCLIPLDECGIGRHLLYYL
jgi:hypothetical protein